MSALNRATPRRSDRSRARRLLLKLCLALACFVLGALGGAYLTPSLATSIADTSLAK